MLTEGEDRTVVPEVPAPVAPDDPDAWYAPDVREQDEIYPGVVVTVTETDRRFAYDVREPQLSNADRDALPTELVALLWLLYEHYGVVLFYGPTGVGKTTLRNAPSSNIPLRVRLLHTEILLVQSQGSVVRCVLSSYSNSSKVWPSGTTST